MRRIGVKKAGEFSGEFTDLVVDAFYSFLVELKCYSRSIDFGAFHLNMSGAAANW